MYYRLTRKQRRFSKRAITQEEGGCDFCDPHNRCAAVYEETEHAIVVLNASGYDQWETRRVLDHRMILPKEHVGALDKLGKPALADIMDLMADYEARGYEIYARAPESITRTQTHQHTHLIKAEAKMAKGMFYWKKPHTLWLFR